MTDLLAVRRIGTHVTAERERTQSVVSERAVLVGVVLPENEDRFDDLNELEGLVEAAKSIPVAKLVQKRDRPNANFYLGKGKVEAQ